MINKLQIEAGDRILNPKKLYIKYRAFDTKYEIFIGPIFDTENEAFIYLKNLLVPSGRIIIKKLRI